MFNFLEFIIIGLCDICVNNHSLIWTDGWSLVIPRETLSKNLVMSNKGNVFCCKGATTSQMGLLEVYIDSLPYNFIFVYSGHLKRDFCQTFYHIYYFKTTSTNMYTF